ncbi:hypothetical protein IEQ34_003306 [Dendrobium chrysotoxum]|uniref:Uncharacterized protein n=1 Tax=Dendrobium chrysotoxum TaxID=161865 RepID=A0AAV7HLA8_DENCH|nr:hypothetical protein IEQ34_003306 [Dendrobium chrysotoxum]
MSMNMKIDMEKDVSFYEQTIFSQGVEIENWYADVQETSSQEAEQLKPLRPEEKFSLSLKKIHANLNTDFNTLQKEHANLVKEYSDLDRDHMSLLDEFDILNKKHVELTFTHDSLKSSHVELENAFKELEELACQLDSNEHALK